MPGEHDSCLVQSVSRDTLSPPGVGVPASPNVVAAAERPPGIVFSMKLDNVQNRNNGLNY
jgi:hypothetical protein